MEEDAPPAATPASRPAGPAAAKAVATAPLLQRWLAEAEARGLPKPDPRGDEERGHVVWRDFFVAAFVEPADPAVMGRLANKGYQLHRFGDPATWPQTFEALAQALAN
jgi:hypothetical protein